MLAIAFTAASDVACLQTSSRSCCASRDASASFSPSSPMEAEGASDAPRKLEDGARAMASSLPEGPVLRPAAAEGSVPLSAETVSYARP